MKKFIELKYHKNHKFEIEFENLDEVKEDDNVILFSKEGDLTPLLILSDYWQLNKQSNDASIYVYIPFFVYNEDLIDDIINREHLLIHFFDFTKKTICENILPKWNIPEDNAILFLSEGDCDRYENIANDNSYFVYPQGLNPRVVNSEMDIRDYSKISIIIPELHQDNINEINNIAKELKARCDIQEINLFASHCFFDELWDKEFWQEYSVLDFDKYTFINKITTTNSTGILQPKKNRRLEVADVKEFFI